MADLSPDFFRAVLDEHETPTVVFAPVRDETGAIVDFTWSYANAAGCSFLPRPLDEIADRTLRHLLSEDPVTAGVVDGSIAVKRRVLETGCAEESVVKFEIRGADYYALVRNAACNGFVVTTYRNVTSRVENDHKLHEFAARLDVATRAAGIGVWERHMSTGVSIWDPRTRVLHGLSADGPAEMRQEDVDRILFPEDVAQIVALTSNLDATGILESRHRVRHADGRVTWLQIFGRLVADERGPRLVGACWDVTQEVEAAAEIEAKAHELEIAAERLATAAEVADIGVWEYDCALERFVWNDEAFEILGMERAGFTGRFSDWRNRIHPDDVHLVKAATDRLLGEGGDITLEHRIVRPSGEERIVRSYSRLIGAPATGRIVGAIIDITDQVRASEELARKSHEAEAANEAKTRFLASISHEIRTPMNGVLGMSQALAMSGVNERQREMIDLIVRSGESLLALLNDILDVSRIEAGAMPIASEAFPLGRLVRDVGGLFSARAEACGLGFAVEIAPEADCDVLGDELRVRQILNNLVSNAVKFTEAGEVRVRADRDPATGDFVLSVKDTGVGVAPDQQARIFQAFVQADDSSTRRFGGSGLGLAIVRRLAQAMGGEITLESAVGEGSTFTVRLPLPLAPAAEAAAEPPPTAPLKRRVLVVDDNATNRRVVEAILSAVGVDLAFAVDGPEGIAAWEAETFDVILMDSMMPKMTGSDAARAIRAKERETGRTRTPIVAVTGDVLPKHREAYLAAGMDGMVEKPIDPRALIEAVRDAIQSREPARKSA